MLNNAIGRLRIISIIEGLSYIFLMYHSIYSKRILGIEDAIKTPGMIHGVLFVIFSIALLDTMLAKKWSFPKAALLFITSLIPLGFIAIELWLKKLQKQNT